VIPQAPAVQASVAGTRDLWSKLAWPLLLACGLLIFVSASSIYLVIASQSSREVTNRTLQLENRLWENMAVVRIAESEQRGYLLTGDPGYLEIYRNTIDASVAAVADLRSAVANDPVQQRAVAQIEPLMVRKFDELQETMRLYDAGDHAAALALVARFIQIEG
jgi:CHASE3 domain sensor protein